LSRIWRKYEGLRKFFQPAKYSQRRKGLRIKIKSRAKLGKCGLKVKVKVRCYYKTFFKTSEKFKVAFVDYLTHTQKLPGILTAQLLVFFC